MATLTASRTEADKPASLEEIVSWLARTTKELREEVALLKAEVKDLEGGRMEEPE